MEGYPKIRIDLKRCNEDNAVQEHHLLYLIFLFLTGLLLLFIHLSTLKCKSVSIIFIQNFYLPFYPAKKESNKSQQAMIIIVLEVYPIIFRISLQL